MRYIDTLGHSREIELLAHLLRQRINAALTPLGLSSPKYEVLSILEEKQALTNADLARACSVTPQTMNRLVRGLQAEGFLQQTAAESHAQKLLYQLTPKAQELICRAHTAVNAIEQHMVQDMDAQQEKLLRALLEQAQQALRSL